MNDPLKSLQIPFIAIVFFFPYSKLSELNILTMAKRWFLHFSLLNTTICMQITKSSFFSHSIRYIQ